ncbi:MAG: hypothetical protein ACI861_001412 [Paracoccaceae bacterium]
MTDSNIQDFRKRMNKYEKGGKGWRSYLNGRRRASGKPLFRLRVPWFTTVLVLSLVFGMKAFIVLRVGEQQYRVRLAAYHDPTLGEQIGLYVMRPDPVTMTLRDFADPIIGR